jgi:hypothetical protein
MGAIGERFFVDDPQRQQAFGELVGHHCRAVAGQKSAGKAPFLNRLRKSMHQVFGGLGKIPLQMAAQSRMVIQDAQRDRSLPPALSCEHFD